MPDADIIIHLHAVGLWDVVKAGFRVHVPSTIVREVWHYKDPHGFSVPIDLPAQVATGEIAELAADQDDLFEVVACFTPEFLEGLHVGELEALALIWRGKYAEGWFCTCDWKAIEALAALGFAERGAAAEIVLRAVGRTLSSYMRRRQFTDEYFRLAIESGKDRRLTGAGLNVSLFDQL